MNLPPRPRTFAGAIYQAIAIVLCLFASVYVAQAIIAVTE